MVKTKYIDFIKLGLNEFDTNIDLNIPKNSGSRVRSETENELPS